MILQNTLVDYQFLVPQGYIVSTRKLATQTDDSPSRLDTVPIRLPYLGISIGEKRKRPLVRYYQSVVTLYFSYSDDNLNLNPNLVPSLLDIRHWHKDK